MKVSEFDRIVAAELARPANTTAYSTGQVIGSHNLNQVLTFSNAGRGSSGATGYVRSIRLLTNQSACQAVITVWLYNLLPTVIADGVAFQNLWAERARCLGSYTCAALAAAGNSDYAVSENWLSTYHIYGCSTVNSTLYAQLVTGTGFTPASGQIFRVELGLHQNESGNV